MNRELAGNGGSFAIARQLTIGQGLNLSAVTLVFALCPAFADEPAARPETKSDSKQTTAPQDSQAVSAALPEFFEKLNLSPKQQDQIRETIHEYDQSIKMVWGQYSKRYMQTIAMETSLLAAIEDNLTETQRQQIREQRRKIAQHEIAKSARDNKPSQAQSAIVPPVDDVLKAGVTLTDEQQELADKAHEKYRSQLRSLNREIQGLHNRLLSLEADKLAALEKLLTKDQLALLRQNRQNGPQATKVDVSRTQSSRKD